MYDAEMSESCWGDAEMSGCDACGEEVEENNEKPTKNSVHNYTAATTDSCHDNI